MGKAFVRVVTELDPDNLREAPCLIVNQVFIDEHPLHFTPVAAVALYGYLSIVEESNEGETSCYEQLHGVTPLTYIFTNDTPQEHPYVRLMQMYLHWARGNGSTAANKRMTKLLEKRGYKPSFYTLLTRALLGMETNAVGVPIGEGPHPDDLWQEL